MALTYNPKAGISGTTSGMQTVSQQRAKMFADLDPKQLTPFQRNQIGSREEIEKEKELARQLIESEKVSPDAKLTIKDQPVKETPKPTAKPAEARSKANLWRVMLEGVDSKNDLFANTEDDARKLLEKMGGKGAVAGIQIGGKNKEEEQSLKDQYIKKAQTGGVGVESTATLEQRKKYLANLERLSSGKKAREKASKEQISKDKERFERFTSGAGRSQFASDIAAKRASEDQLNQYNKQLSSLKKAYRNAGRAGDYVEQYRIGDFLNSYTAGVPKEMGARQKASQRGMIAAKNKELEEKIRRDREARIAAERASRANPDYDQFNSQPTYQRNSYPEQFANNITFSNL
jgi:hypothetical protein